MKIQFTRQDYQYEAVEAVANVFNGQALAIADFNLAPLSAAIASDGLQGIVDNQLTISNGKILENIRAIQRFRNLDLSEALLDAEDGDIAFPQISVEMETGTGKTYVFIRTIYELNKRYGFTKFLIVVPSVAIREGVMKNLAITAAHFADEFNRAPCSPILYDPAKPAELRHFAQNNVLSILIINIDSFAKTENKINRRGESECVPMAYIRATNPIVVLDEAQNFETEKRKDAIKDLNPLAVMRYSATHKHARNLVYQLSTMDAYQKGLVKIIEVEGVEADHAGGAYVKCEDIKRKGNGYSATLLIDQNMKSGIKRNKVAVKLGDDLFDKSGKNPVYANNFIVYRLNDYEVEFSNHIKLVKGEECGGCRDDELKYQIERTIAAHFEKLKRCKPLGIKVLSLFFIDKVANYRGYRENGDPYLGKFGVWFEEIFAKYVQKSEYRGLIPQDASQVHNGYFASDKGGKKGTGEAEIIWRDSTERGAKGDEAAYDLIMRDKERLLSLDEPLQFIFSHSALREGWDNPNVFQICTLNETQSGMKKRQEIGRGLRLCVNQRGERIAGTEGDNQLSRQINRLTVIANQSYESFVKSLQRECVEDGALDAPIPKDARKKARVKRRSLDLEEKALFKDLWNKINYRTAYQVNLDTREAIRKSIEALKDDERFPRARPLRVRARQARIDWNSESRELKAIRTRGEVEDAAQFTPEIPDVYAYIESRVSLSRPTINAILKGSGRLGELLINPQAFLENTVRAITETLQCLLVEGIEYRKIPGRHYGQSLCDVDLEIYEDNLAFGMSKTLLEAERKGVDNRLERKKFECVITDSEVEKTFARDCSTQERVKFFLKLPAQFKIPTPLGNYNPDWALISQNGSRMYFVAETKSSLSSMDLREKEHLKIRCGRKHFDLAAIQDVRFKATTKLEDILSSH